ncbi:ABC transporter ATP-binding protein [Sinomonas terrae]|uniref:ATP-binding cassette domain-containing protein n=1 Tax=Sinomonas terrae TaxID=2908838 RepID=A0ABS9U2V2_9MICC|nr:ATP-binding cassette domain-containing protein [Sinomonas terrae]MCH6471022.1 ATP-binding cassette domain-containing protein [Sinomonas terrae]
MTAGYIRGSRIFDDASLSISGPGLFHLRGRNGSGKSTFAELASGYLRPWAGQVLVNGINATNRDAREARRVCRAEPALFPAMTVHDHIALTATARGISPEPALDRAVMLGLEPWLAENAGSLSTGTAKKLWYLMNTLGDFDLAVLDEPFNGVDTESVAVMAKEMTEWAKTACVVLIAHALQAELEPDRVIEISELTS